MSRQTKKHVGPDRLARPEVTKHHNATVVSDTENELIEFFKPYAKLNKYVSVDTGNLLHNKEEEEKNK